MDWRMFSPSGLAEALTDSGHKVSERTVQRWKAGAQPRPADLRAIRDLVGHSEKPRPDEPDGAISALLERWNSPDAPPWAKGLTTQIIEAIEGSRRADIRTAIAEALAEQAALSGGGARRGAGKAPRNDIPSAGGARRRPRSSK